MTSSIHRIRIHTKPEAVFQAISTEEGMKGWYTANLEGSFDKGGISAYRFPKNEVFEWKTTGLAFPERLERECIAGPGAAKGTKVVWTLEAQGENDTILRLEHTGWPENHEALATCNTLWGILLGNLRRYTESGQPAPMYN